jgi:hypothetical protein
MRKLAPGLGLLALWACASATPPPSGPGILVLPGTGKSFDLFRSDDQACRSFALSEVSAKAADLQGDSYAAGTLMQQRYDQAFAQCMYARGHKVPVVGPYSETSRPPQSAARTPPPPPPGLPPPDAPPDYRPK